MTISEQKTAAEAARELWVMVLPDVEPPEPYRFFTWASNFSQSAITRGITRAAAKYRKLKHSSTPMTAEEVGRYASGVMRSEMERTI